MSDLREEMNKSELVDREPLGYFVATPSLSGDGWGDGWKSGDAHGGGYIEFQIEGY